MSVKRCKWCNLSNPLYVAYHDKEWGVPNHEDQSLFEILLLETFQAGLSWECVLNKRDAFRKAFDGFDVYKVAHYDEKKIGALMNDTSIIRNRLKIKAAVMNARVFLDIVKERGSFDAYIWSFTNVKTVRMPASMTSSDLSDEVSADLKRRGMKFVGTITIQSYLQAVGIINAHERNCWRYN